MKQPKNEIGFSRIWGWDTVDITVNKDYSGTTYGTAIVAVGKTKLSALNFALRRAERLVRDIKKMIEAEK